MAAGGPGDLGLHRSDPAALRVHAGRSGGSPRPSTARSPPATTAAAAAATPIDGTYSVTTTLEDLKASGAAPIDWVPENWGESVYVFDRGRFATTQHNDEACTWAYGRYAVNGDVMTLDFDGGGGLAPNDRATRPGEHFGFGWSLYRDVLTLSPMEGEPAPAGRPGTRGSFSGSAPRRTCRRSISSARRRPRPFPTDTQWSSRGDGRHHGGAVPDGAVDREGAAESLHPVGEPAQAGAGRGVGATGAVIGDAGSDLVVLLADIECRPGLPTRA